LRTRACSMPEKRTENDSPKTQLEPDPNSV
jgi:hypothetical protein